MKILPFLIRYEWSLIALKTIGETYTDHLF